MLCWFLGITCVVLAVLLAISVAMNIRHGKLIIDVSDALTEALDVCDATYSSISTVADMPVAADSAEVREVVRRIVSARDAILHISNVLAGPWGIVSDANEDEDVL